MMPVLGRLRKEDIECEASLGHIARPCLKRKKKKKKGNIIIWVKIFQGGNHVFKQENT
jgi:hypothetical protein